MAVEMVTTNKPTVQRTVRFKLDRLTTEDKSRLDQTINEYSIAFNAVSEAGWKEHRINAFELHKKTYYPLRSKLALPSQLIISARSKAVESIKSARRLKGGQPVMMSPSIRYDARSYSFDWKSKTISLAANGGRRIETTFSLDKHSSKFAGLKARSADLVKRKRHWFLHVVVEQEVNEPVPTGRIVGVDRGINKPAVTSNGKFLGSRRWRDIESRYLSLRRRLQAKGTKSATRHLKRLGSKLGRFRNDCDHVLSKRLVQSVKPGDKLVFEELTGIRNRKIRHGEFSRKLHSWSFRRLESIVAYKASLAGVLVDHVDPRDTSRRCPDCELIDKKNRPDQAHFKCVKCGFARNSDLVASWNIRDRYRGLWNPVSKVPAPVNEPNAGDEHPASRRLKPAVVDTSPLALDRRSN